MKIHLISDIHIEMDKNLRLTAPSQADVIVLAGDVANGLEGITWVQENYGSEKPIVYIAGNHEFYFNDLAVTKDIAKITSGTNIHFLDNQSTIIDGVRFIGTTLWTSFNDWSDLDVIDYLHRQMNDYKKIRAKDFFSNPELVKRAQEIQPDIMEHNGARKGALMPVITYMLHIEAVKYLKLELSKPFDGKTVVITHHAPSYKSICPSKLEYEDAYASSLEYLIVSHKDVITAWFHGHLHVPVNYEISGVPIISNPRDYPFYAWDPGVSEFIFEV